MPSVTVWPLPTRTCFGRYYFVRVVAGQTWGGGRRRGRGRNMMVRRSSHARRSPATVDAAGDGMDDDEKKDAH